MKKILSILLLLLALPFNQGMGARADIFTSRYGVQVPISERKTDYGARQIHYGEKSTLTNGHFQTTVNALDVYGHAYCPGQMTNGNTSIPNRGRMVGHDDDEDDPMMGNVVPVGNIPWILMLILSLGYFCFKLITRTRARSARVH